MLARLAHFTARHRRAVIVAWQLLTPFGAFAAAKVSKRWYQSFSVPGKSGYETSQRTLQTFGVGDPFYKRDAYTTCKYLLKPYSQYFPENLQGGFDPGSLASAIPTRCA